MMRILLLVLTATLSSALLAAPSGAPRLALADAERLALERDASLQALDARANAMSEQAVADGALPDPELTLGSRNQPVDDLSASHEGMAHFVVSARQRFPAGETRHLRRKQGELEAAALRARYDRRALEIRQQVRTAWLDWRLAHASLELVREAESELETLAELVQRRMASGAAQQRDVSQLRLERAALSERVIGFQRDREAAAAELARWLDEPIAGRVPGPAPDWPPPEAEALRDQLAAHPELQVLEHRSNVGELGTSIAQEAYGPTWMVEVGYGFRRASDRMTGASQPDLLTGMVTVSLPLFPGHRQDRRLEAARQRHTAVRFDQVDRRRALEGRVERLLSVWQRQDELAEFYATQFLPEAEHYQQASLSAYRADRASFDELVRARLRDIDYRLRALQVGRRRDDAHVELRYLAGE